MRLILAPLHGFTDATFREVYFRHFRGFDSVMAPFVSLTHGRKISALKVKDLVPQFHSGIPVIPQILGNEPGDFILMSHYLHTELGYDDINWNLGCPSKGIVNKKRGCGLLPHPAEIDRFLERVIPLIPVQLSVKMRLGHFSADESFKVLPVLNKYPLSSIIMHPRIGIQQYTEKVLLDDFEHILQLIHHNLTYNGDIFSLPDFQAIKSRFSAIDSFMLGRGIFYNPFLAEMIKSGNSSLPTDASIRFINFYHELEASEKAFRNSWMSRMKEYWKYFIEIPGMDKPKLSQLLRCRNDEEWNSITSGLFTSTYE